MPRKVSMWCVICRRSEAFFEPRIEMLDPKWSRVFGFSKTCLEFVFFGFFYAAGMASKPADVAAGESIYSAALASPHQSSSSPKPAQSVRPLHSSRRAVRFCSFLRSGVVFLSSMLLSSSSSPSLSS
jgi:hypothetical protein